MMTIGVESTPIMRHKGGPIAPKFVDMQSARKYYASRLSYHLLNAVQDPHPSGERNEEAAHGVMKSLRHTGRYIV